MSDHIPFEIQHQIIKRLPVKSLIQFRTVSKQWNSLIDSSEFIFEYNNQTQPQHHILVRYKNDPQHSEYQFVSIIDNHTFPQHKFSVPIPNTLLKSAKILDTSHGLFCLYKTNTVILWNPTIRKSVTIDVPYVSPFLPYVGFGVCPRTNDPKLVKFTYIDTPLDLASDFSWQVEVFSLSSGAWKVLYMNLPSLSNMGLTDIQVCIDGYMYWLAFDMIYSDDTVRLYPWILWFDITSEEFIKVCLPDSLALQPDITLFISKLRGCLVVLGCNIDVREREYGVWMMMEHGMSFTKLFTIYIPDGSIRNVLGFRRSGEPMVQLINEDNVDQDPIVVYEPSSGHVSNIGISGFGFSCFARSYVETLLLLDQ